MDRYIHEDRDALGPRIDAMMAGEELPPWVTGYDREFGVHPIENAPAIRISLHVSANLRIDQILARQYIATVTRLRQDLADVAPGYEALFSLTRPTAELG